MNTLTQAQLVQLNAALLNNPMTFGRPSLPLCASDVRSYAIGHRLPDWAVSEVTGAVKDAVDSAIRCALGVYSSEDQGAFASAYAGGLPDLASLILNVPLAAVAG
jgi:hypothetical protein